MSRKKYLVNEAGFIVEEIKRQSRKYKIPANKAFKNKVKYRRKYKWSKDEDFSNV